jgi:two-component system, OmpR family, sensor histidine kinase QseC
LSLTLVGALKRWLQPSLVRRLVLAQMATSALLWVILAGVISLEVEDDDEAKTRDIMRRGAAVVLNLAQALDAQPELLAQSIRGLDDFQRSVGSPAGVSAGASAGVTDRAPQLPRIYVYRDGQLIYRSSDADANLKLEAHRGESLHKVTVNGMPWHQYVEDSPDKRFRFVALAPATLEAYGFTPWSRSWLLLPLMVSLPLLLLPAWLSVQLALRPWARVSGEIAARGPDDLQPLRFVPVHRELSPLTRAVNLLLSRLRAARGRERSFIADAAHELRTPIAAIQVNAEALKARKLSPLDLELLDGLLKSNDRAARLVSQLLALTRSDASPELKLTDQVDLEDLVQNVLATWAALAQQRGVELDLTSQPGLQVSGDAESLTALIDNLVGNAVKYSPPIGTVRVKVQRDLAAVLLTVTDEGPGIAPELRERVFERFFRAPGQAQSGSGLGLAIAKAVADRHGASLALSSGPGGVGLQVELRMPSAMAPDQKRSV